MILFRPFATRQAGPAQMEVRAGELVSAEQAAAQQAAIDQGIPGAPNPYNAILEQQAAQARNLTQAIQRRVSTTTGPGGAWVMPASEPFHRPFNVNTVGDNFIVSGAEGLRIAIHQMELWNTLQQTIRLLDGTTDLIGPLETFPAQAGLNLRWQDEPHFKLSYGQPFKINLGAGRVTGFLKYRMVE